MSTRFAAILQAVLPAGHTAVYVPAEDCTMDAQVDVLKAGAYCCHVQLGHGCYSVARWHAEQGMLETFGDFGRVGAAVECLLAQLGK